MPTAPTAAITGHASAITATGFTIYLDAIPAENVTAWALDYRVRNKASPASWTRSASGSTILPGDTIAITGLTENGVYEVALLAVNGATDGPHGTIMVLTPNNAGATWDGSEIVQQITSLVDDNLKSTLGLARVTQEGTLRDLVPSAVSQSARLPAVLVELKTATYAWHQMPRSYNIQYEIRVLYVGLYTTTQAVVNNRTTIVGRLIGLFTTFKQLNLSGGATTKGQVAYVLPALGELRPEEDDLIDHDKIMVVAVNLSIEATARA